MNETAMEVLLPKTKTIIICGTKLIIGPLSFRRIDRALKLMSASAVKISLEKEEKDQHVIMKIFQDLGEQLGIMVSILTGIPEEKTEDVSLEDISELALAIAETNDFGKIFSNFQKATVLSMPKK